MSPRRLKGKYARSGPRIGFHTLIDRPGAGGAFVERVHRLAEPRAVEPEIGDDALDIAARFRRGDRLDDHTVIALIFFFTQNLKLVFIEFAVGNIFIGKISTLVCTNDVPMPK